MQNFYRYFSFGLILLSFIVSCQNQSTAFIDNDFVTITLGCEKGGAPVIKTIQIKDKSVILKNSSDKNESLSWIQELIGIQEGSVRCTGWNIGEDTLYYRATSGFYMKQFYIELHVNLLKDSPYLKVYYVIKNEDKESAKIERFPIFIGNWNIDGEKAVVKWWDALDYTPNTDTITSETNISLQSRMYSSDNYNYIRGNLPYWQLQNSQTNIYFGLAWSGGWNCRISSDGNNSMITDVHLPVTETQLVLKSGESISGPELFISPIAEANEMIARSKWFSFRKELSKKTYGYKPLNYPLIYNHWYAAEFAINSDFLKGQLGHVSDYGFDAFVIDAGWYKGIGAWTPDTVKFRQGELESILSLTKSENCFAGLWSCPQLKASPSGENTGELDFPGRYVPFLDAYLMDYLKIDFSKVLDSHLDTLTQTLKANWWKYDQDFFAKETKQGKMKNVIAMQTAFDIARKLHPSLVIESCMSGGKMINEFTDAIAQIHWIRDGERSGYLHALTNISEAIGATDFLEPQKVERWTNRINEVDISNPELLKFYCRSCMLGTWGISADLTKINPLQKSIVVKEISNYRKLNELKACNLYEHEFPREYSGNVSAAYYNNDFTEAGILVYRMFPRNEKIERKIQLHLNPDKMYRVTNADTGEIMEFFGNDIVNKKFIATLNPAQLSVIYFIEALN